MTLIGIHGKGGSGKDTVGEILRDNHGFGITAFALPIKTMICGLLEVAEEKWDDREWRETPIELFGGRSPRYMAQTIGTEWGRMLLSQTIWLDLTLLKIEGAGNTAITDVRFDNEADRIRDLGGYMIIVHRTESDLLPEQQAHRSEFGLRNARSGEDDFHINNFGTLEDLEAQVTQIVDRILVLEEEKNLEEVQSDPADPAGTGD